LVSQTAAAIPWLRGLSARFKTGGLNSHKNGESAAVFARRANKHFGMNVLGVRDTRFIGAFRGGSL